MAEDEAFLAQIESFGLPPPEKKLIDDDTVVPSSTTNISYDLAVKISNIHLNKQKPHLKSDVIAPSGGMLVLATAQSAAIHEQITSDQVAAWKTQVLSSNRPRNQWQVSEAADPVEDSRAYARAIASRMSEGGTTHEKRGSTSSIDDELLTRELQTKSSSPPGSSRHSDYSSASSHKSASPPQASPNSTSDYSVSISPYHRPQDIYREASRPQEIYRSLLSPEAKDTPPPAKRSGPPVPKKTVTIVEGARVVPIESTRSLPKAKGPPRTGPVYHGGLRSQTRSANFNPLNLPMDTSNYAWVPSTSRGRDEEKAHPLDDTEPAVRGVIRVVEQREPERSELRPAFPDEGSRPESVASSNESATSSVKELRRKKWRELAAAVEEEEEELKRLARDSERIQKGTKTANGGAANISGGTGGPIVVPAKAPSAAVLGDCAGCHQRVLSSDKSVTTEERQLFHSTCFICSVCKRHLGDRHHISAKGRLFCEEDYRYTGMHETTEKCAKCAHPIVDMVLQALGRYFHPACFRCTACKCCLDGVPFALDTKGEVYCMPDYHERFAPRCAACAETILPDPRTGETVRVVAINNDYHVGCYVCEGCNTRLTDDSSSKCYPLGRHLLCYDCHLLWRRTGGDEQPITDL